MQSGIGVDRLQLWVTQLVHALEYGVLFAFIIGIGLTVLGVVFIIPAAQPQNSASWLGRQINPILCTTTMLAGTFLIGLAAFSNFWIEVLIGVEAGTDNPLYWGDTSSRNEDELVRIILRLFMALMGLYALIKGALNLSKIGSQDPPKRPIGSTVGMWLLAAVFFMPHEVANWLTGFIPFFGTVASVLDVRH